jgi:mono/diheme cytochrome c family protein
MRVFGLIVTAGAWLSATPALATETGPIAAGRSIAQTWCVNCHVVTATQTTGSDQAPTWPGIASRPGITAETLRSFLEKPHGKMPDFKLSGQDIDNVVAYILSLKP